MIGNNNSLTLTNGSVKPCPCDFEYLSVDEAEKALDIAIDKYQQARSLVRSGRRDLASPTMMETYRLDAQRCLNALRESMANLDMARHGFPTVHSQLLAQLSDREPATAMTFEVGVPISDLDTVVAEVHEQFVSGEWECDGVEIQTVPSARAFTVAALNHILRDIAKFPLRRLNGAYREPGAFEAGVAAVRRQNSQSRKAA